MFVRLNLDFCDEGIEHTVRETGTLASLFGGVVLHGQRETFI